MKKTIATIAAVALVAMTGLFAQPAKGKKADAKPVPPAPEFKAPPKMELPAEADVKAYHDAELQSYKILLDAQVKAKIITPEWAEARLAALKAFQADCKGQCFFFKASHIYMADHAGRPFFEPRPRSHNFDGPCKDFKPTHDMKGQGHKRRHPSFDPNFNEAQPDVAEEVEVR
ncbi:MAG: hypothetical protein IJS51_02425 [Treponema sp.]|nr:hypothetical protein [Treponema sp.]